MKNRLLRGGERSSGLLGALALLLLARGSALGAFGAFCLAIWKGKINPQSLRSALLRAAHGTCMIAMILLGASIFGYFFTLTQVTQNLVAFVGGLHVPAWVVLTLILCGYIVLGSFMDQIAILVLTVPIVLPLIMPAALAAPIPPAPDASAFFSAPATSCGI